MKIVNENEFSASIEKGVTLVDFYATWCGPCRVMADILEDVEDSLEDKAQIVKVDVDDSPNIARQFGIMSIPTLIIFKDGKLQEKHLGIWQYEDCL
ncbi:MAG: thioredoxin [Clostridia bacterium]|nr:thioredoxin [Clostridia bacterium]